MRGQEAFAQKASRALTAPGMKHYGPTVRWWPAWTVNVMRHAFGLILGLLLTPALAYGSAWGYVQAGASYDALNQTIGDRTRMIGSFTLLAAVGLVTGIVILARWASPFVSLVPAVAFIGWSAYFLAAPGSALSLPGHLPPGGTVDSGLRVLLGYGVFGLLGFALLVPSWAPNRWRGDRAAPDDGGPQEQESRRSARRRREFNAFD